VERYFDDHRTLTINAFSGRFFEVVLEGHEPGTAERGGASQDGSTATQSPHPPTRTT
jgi:hypothetical protein